MPIEISQRCTTCGTLKPRDANFESQVYARTPNGKMRRHWLTICKACLEARPQLRASSERFPAPRSRPFERSDGKARGADADAEA